MIYALIIAGILLGNHKDLESITLYKEVSYIKQLMEPVVSKLIYNGFWLSPEMKMLMAAINKSQELIDGTVYLSLYKGNVMIEGRESPSSLYNKELSSMDIEGGYDQKDANGFIKIIGLRLKMQGENP